MSDPIAQRQSIAPGLYESVVTVDLADRLEGLKKSGFHTVEREVTSESAPFVLARHIGTEVERALRAVDPKQRVDVANRILTALASANDADTGHQIKAGPKELIAVVEEQAAGVFQVRPLTPLSENALLTNAPEERSLGSELRAELATADRVDLLCAFVKWHGLRVIEEQLRQAQQRNVPIRVITTTYMGATERRALDRLVRDFGAEVKVNYELYTTRLHAKAWLFRRNTGFHTAYVGSSNLSKAALLDGLEWNVRLSNVASPTVLRKFAATFDSYWSNPDFKSYDPDRDAEELDRALEAAGKPWDRNGGRTLDLAKVEMRPLPHQREMLEELDRARAVHGHHHNLLVSATGTGKTWLAAFDYKELAKTLGKEPTLLFVAHRKEILEQAAAAYRSVLGNGNFGELYVDGNRPKEGRHVFASIQSLTAGGGVSYPADHFDVLVIDEFHHAAADTYRAIIEHFTPREFLGLTATPERADGVRVQDEFFEGRVAAELRLWQALADGLLSPFHYFGVHDNTDLRGVGWRQGSYDRAELTRLLTRSNTQAHHVLNAVQDKVSDPFNMRALGFCVSVRHAQYMADAFNAAGLNALSLSGETPSAEREKALKRLESGDVQVLFSVDLFNEGLDIPSVDTLLLLRPTSSATIFLQQLGRGLRRAEGKSVLTVLDFIGFQRQEFRFEDRFRALTGHTKQGIQRDLEQDFPTLPEGCQILLDRVSKDIVLKNIKEQLNANVKTLAQEVRQHGDTALAGYLGRTGRSLLEVYRAKHSWTEIRFRAGLGEDAQSPEERKLLERVVTLAQVDDPERVEAYLKLTDDDAPDFTELDPRMQTYAAMLFFALWPDGEKFSSIAEGLRTLKAHRALRSELREVFAHGLETTTYAPRPLLTDLSALSSQPLAVHAHYSRPELLAALQWAELGKYLPAKHNAGVAWCPKVKTDALMITIEKDEKSFSENTRYRDFALNEELFHWDSQNQTSPTSPTGRRYQNHRENGSAVLLFVRRETENEIGRPNPYVLLGPADYVSHEGGKPMAVTWKLHTPLPADVQHFTSVTAG
ncbi:DUF3427 domain-containing protein [Kitasatospora sp. NPDC059722]|uniref:DUF3427 domain-containing protein n=1 Tax=Kitasatospora sp. NPDC059722 TaxID=3346925 RepID=UPI0036A86999